LIGSERGRRARFRQSACGVQQLGRPGTAKREDADEHPRRQRNRAVIVVGRGQGLAARDPQLTVGSARRQRPLAGRSRPRNVRPTTPVSGSLWRQIQSYARSTASIRPLDPMSCFELRAFLHGLRSARLHRRVREQVDHQPAQPAIAFVLLDSRVPEQMDRRGGQRRGQCAQAQ
jgi:hypothetical protein